MSGWSCAQCGELDASSIVLYQEGMLNACSRRYDPRCATCAGPATFQSDGRRINQPAVQVLVISGSCSSGKTTISYLLSKHYGMVQIDGDWILERQKARQGRKADFNEIHGELLAAAEGLAFLGQSAVLAHLILPAYVPMYEAFLRARSIDHRLVILMPERATLLSWNQERKCWPKTTPEYWVNRFYDDLLVASDDVKAYYYDNSHETPLQTAKNIKLGRLSNVNSASSQYAD